MNLAINGEAQQGTAELWMSEYWRTAKLDRDVSVSFASHVVQVLMAAQMQR